MNSYFTLWNDEMENLRLVHENTGDKREIHLKVNGIEIDIPYQIALMISTFIATNVVLDSTVDSFSFDFEFRNEKSLDYITKLLVNSNFKLEKSILEDEKIIYDFANFGLKFGINAFVKPLSERLALENNLEDITIKDILNIIEYKLLISKFKSSQSESHNADNELQYLSEHFYCLFEDPFFVEWCKDMKNIDIVERIIANPKLQIKSEDSLILFIMSLGKVDQSFNMLFSYVLFEYCSKQIVEKFIQYITKHFKDSGISRSDHGIIECLCRRCLKLKGIEQRLEGRQKEVSLITTSFENMNNPRNGILFNQMKSNNVIITASSNNNPNSEKFNIIHLIEEFSNFSYYTHDEQNANITFSLKDGNEFIVTGYMIRGNWNSNHTNQLMSWELKGQYASTKEWVTIDYKPKESPFDNFEIRKFTIPETEPLLAVKLIQIGENYSHRYKLSLSAFEIFGKLLH